MPLDLQNKYSKIRQDFVSDPQLNMIYDRLWCNDRYLEKVLYGTCQKLSKT